MLTAEQTAKLIRHDLNFVTSRSGGKGGQNVNKVESKVELVFFIPESLALNNSQKKTLLGSLSSRIHEGTIRIHSQESRSQLKNKENCIAKLIDLLNRLLKPKKKRIATVPGKAAKEKKRREKKIQKEKKDLRKKLYP